MKSTTRLRIATTDAVENVPRLLREAPTPAKFLSQVEGQDFLGGADFTTASSTLVCEAPDLTAFSTPDSDIHASIAVYKWLGSLTRAAAQDRRLWTYLTFVTFAKYANARWPLDAAGNWKGRVEDRWLFNKSSLNRITRHALARLWWAAFITHDPELSLPLSASNSDEWAYLKVLLRRQDAFQAVADRSVGSIKGVRVAVLEYLAKHEELTEKDVREFLKEIDLSAGFKELASLDSGQIRNLVNEIAEYLQPWGRTR
jgi:hypothetical protein